MEIILPKRRFAAARRIVRRHMPGFYGWTLKNPTLRRAFRIMKGKRTIALDDDLAQRFTTIYETHFWEDDESRSGGGSNLWATEKIRKAIPSLFLKYEVRSVLDLPCGDFNWFKEIRMDLDSYIGGDIVAPLISSVAKKYTSPTRKFRVMDITRDALPDCDLILVRGCFIHLSFELIFAALRNITQSNIRYLLTTQFKETAANRNIEIGGFQPINVCAPPFNFPPALELIDDDAKGLMPRQLGLWRVDDLRHAIPIASFSRSGAHASGNCVPYENARTHS